MLMPLGSSRVRSAHRAGTASLELAIAFPFLTILAGMIFTVTWSCLMKGQAIQEARGRAWHARSGVGGGSLPSGANDLRLSGLSGRSADEGLRSGSGSKTRDRVQHLTVAPRYFYFGSVTARAEHEVFSNPWDNETIPFEEQAPMALDRRVYVFGLSAVAGKLLGALKDAVQPQHGESEAWQKAQNATNTVKQEKDHLDREIETLEGRLSDLRDRLAKARAAKDKDDALIGRLEDDIERTRKSLEIAKKSREHLQKGLNLLPTPS
jgi:hypothetical protein